MELRSGERSQTDKITLKTLGILSNPIIEKCSSTCNKGEYQNRRELRRKSEKVRYNFYKQAEYLCFKLHVINLWPFNLGVN